MKLIFLTTVLLLTLCSTVVLATGKLVVKEAEVRQVIADFLQRKSENLGLELKVKKIGYSGDMSLPAGAVSYEVVVPDRWEGWGNANLALIVRVNDRVERNLGVKVEVEAMADMVVTNRQLERGEVITAADVALQKRDLAKYPGRWYRTLEDVVGKRVRTAIRGNNTIRYDSLEKLPLVKSGQMVTILAENDSLRVTAPGRARNSGAEGDTIMVQNLSSQKEVSARVIDATTVKVEF